jgi:hypothetical protein
MTVEARASVEMLAARASVEALKCRAAEAFTNATEEMIGSAV